MIQKGRRLVRTTDRLRLDFKRVSDWEWEQTVIKLHHLHGAAFVRHATISDKVATDEQPVLGHIHNSTPQGIMRQAFEEFVTIQENRKLTTIENDHLLQPVCMAEVVTARTGLNQHKEAGPDGLKYDFYEDSQTILEPAMVILGNELLTGKDPPPSFLEGLIIPLCKMGDSSSMRWVTVQYRFKKQGTK